MAAAHSHMIQLGATAPEFELPATNGQMVTRESGRGPAGLLVVFICNHCPFVTFIESRLAFIAREIQSLGIGVVAINSNDVERYPDDSPEKMREFAERNHFSFPYLFDETQEVAKAYQGACTPDFFLFDSNLRLTYRGQFDDARPNSGAAPTGDDLMNAARAQVKGEPPVEEQKPSMGCSIKWKPGSEPNYG